MAEEESEVFEITDFTTASQWERFIARFEEIIHEWKLTNLVYENALSPDDFGGSWEDFTEKLDFAGFNFVVWRHRLVPPRTSSDEKSQDGAVISGPNMANTTPTDESNATDVTNSVPFVWQDLLSTANDFPPKTHHLCRWYGLRDLLIVSPGENMEGIQSESRLNILLSSVATAVINTGCCVPVFVSLHSKARKLYRGHYEIPGYRTSFEMVHLRSAPRHCTHMSGLLDIFKSKLACPLPSMPSVSIACKFTYILQDWALAAWSQSPPDIESSTGTEVGISDFESLPFGSCADPVENLQLSVMWPRLSEEVIVDDETYSDLNPLQAPRWSIRVLMCSKPLCLLGDYIDSYISLCTRKESMVQLLGRAITSDVSEDAPDVSQALSRLTDPSYGLPNLSNVVSKTTTVVTRATSKLQIKPEEAPLPKTILNEILLYLFPDAKYDSDECSKVRSYRSEVNPGQRSEDNTVTEEAAVDTALDNASDMQELYKQFKSSPMDSLPYRLAVVMCVVNHSQGGVRAVAHLWQEIVLEMRYRWENNYVIPGLEAGCPNMACSLLHQKFQMLNCCIVRKQARASETTSITEPASSHGLTDLVGSSQRTQVQDDNKEWGWKMSSSDTSEEDEEFFEAMETEAGYDKNAAGGTAIEGGDGTAMRGDGVMVKKSGRIQTNKPEQIASETGQSRPYVTMDEAATEEGNESPSEEVVDSVTTRGVGNSSQSSPSPSRRVSLVSVTKSSPTVAEPTGQTSDWSVASCPDDTQSEVSFSDTWSHMPEGRIKPFGDLRLLNNTKQRLYVPVTQEPSPMTEDMLEEHAEVLAKLGTSSEGTHLRARLQSACLLSDMESFKSANPGASLGDFVKWYSPRDWVETEERDEQGNIVLKGQLSQRMQIPGNLWVEVWQNAKPVPARRQRRLFDDTKEAEKVLHWLSSMKPSDVAVRLLPMLCHAAMIKLMQQPQSHMGMFKNLLETLTSKGSKLLRASRIDVLRVQDYLRQLSRVEVLMTQGQSLESKLMASTHSSAELKQMLPNIISKLLEQAEVDVPDGPRGPLGKVLQQLFVDAYKSAQDGYDTDSDDDNIRKPSGNGYLQQVDFPTPAAKEFIFRTRLPRPAPWSRPCPQRLYCQVQKEEFRLMGAFSSDTTFQ